jgi:hypothetical protein
VSKYAGNHCGCCGRMCGSDDWCDDCRPHLLARHLPPWDRTYYAQGLDGFRSRGRKGAIAEMMEFWKGRLPFEGHIIHWAYSKLAVAAAASDKRTL